MFNARVGAMPSINGNPTASRRQEKDASSKKGITMEVRIQDGALSSTKIAFHLLSQIQKS